MGKKKTNTETNDSHSLGDLIFIAEGKGVTSFESPKLNITVPFINIRLQRYGLFEIGSPYLQTVSSDGNSENSSFNPQGAPAIDNYQYLPTYIRKGYMYVYNETTSLWNEYLITPEGRYINIFWGDKLYDDTYNVREPAKGAKVQDCIPIRLNEKVWMAYSENQWPAKYVKDVLNDKNKREKRMQKFDSEEWPSQMKKDYATSINDTSATSYQFTYMNTEEDKYTKLAYTESFKFAKAADEKWANVYFAIHDPFGCAEDLCNYINEASIELQLLISSMETGIDPKTIGKQSPEPNPQISELHTLSILIYQILYSPENSNDKGILRLRKKAASRDLLERLLATKKRKELRDKINSIRSALYTLIKSEYYQNILVELEKNDLQNFDDGKNHVLQHLNSLSFDPSNFDRHLDVIDYCDKKLEKEIDSFLMNTMTEGGSIDKIMTKKIDLGILSNVNQACVTLNTLSSVYLKFMAEDEKYLVKYIEWLNSYTIKDLKIDGKIEKFFVVKNADLSELIHSNKGTLETGTTIINTNKRRHQLKAICVSKGKQVRLLEPNPKITLMEKVELSSKDKKRVELLKKIMDNSSFQAFCLLLSAVNLAMACNDASKNGIDKKKIFSIGASITEVASIGIDYASLQLKGSYSGKVAALSKISQALGAFSSILGIVTSSYEAKDAFNKRNPNLGYAWVASAAVSALILKVYITEIFKTSTVTLIKKPSGRMLGELILFFILASVCMYLIFLFTETPIESLIHNCILNERTKKYIPEGETDICKLMQLLIVNQEKIVSADRWKGNISLQLEDLLSILSINIINPEVKIDTAYSKYATTIIEKKTIKEIILKCSFPKVRFDSYIEYGLKLYQKSNNVVKLHKDILMSDELESSANENITLHYTKALSSIPLSETGNIVAFFYARILFPSENEDNSCWPKKVEGKDMYLVRRFKLEEARAISTPIILDKLFRDAFDFLDYCSKRSIDVCTLDDLSLKV